ncbi:MAG: hypothetical protein AXW14_05255 [Alteromonas sp. Nap_26]|nr:MAG: hypothetical protein AXW14_05255 [Alteromonas sp. Nap_26]
MKISDLSQNTIASLFFSVVMLFIVAFDNGVPNFDELKEVSGTLEWFEAKGKNRSTLRFKLKEHEEMFVYHSIAGSISAVKSALIKEGATLKVLYDPNDSDSALWEFETVHPIYQIVSDNHLVKSYRSIAENYKSNGSLGFILLLGGLAFSLFFLAIDWEIKRDVN